MEGRESMENRFTSYGAKKGLKMIVKEYSIIEEFDEKQRWRLEKIDCCVERIREFLKEWQTEYGVKPILKSGIAGIEFFQYLSESVMFNSIIEDEIHSVMYGVDVNIHRDWSVHPLYIELNLQEFIPR